MDTPTKRAPKKTSAAPPAPDARDHRDLLASAMPSRAARRRFVAVSMGACFVLAVVLAVLGGEAVQVALAYSLPAFAIPVALGYLTGSVVDYRQALGALTTMAGGRQ